VSGISVGINESDGVCNAAENNEILHWCRIINYIVSYAIFWSDCFSRNDGVDLNEALLVSLSDISFLLNVLRN